MEELENEYSTEYLEFLGKVKTLSENLVELKDKFLETKVSYRQRGVEVKSITAAIDAMLDERRKAKRQEEKVRRHEILSKTLLLEKYKC